MYHNNACISCLSVFIILLPGLLGEIVQRLGRSLPPISDQYLTVCRSDHAASRHALWVPKIPTH